MTFSIQFVALTKADARAKVEELEAPDAIKMFLFQAIDAIADDRSVSVKALGHLFDPNSSTNDENLVISAYDTSSAIIEVMTIEKLA